MTAAAGAPFFADLDPVERIRDERLDYYVPTEPKPRAHPAVVFVHGGPVPADQQPNPGSSGTALSRPVTGWWG